MHTDRHVKSILAIIATGVWILILTQISLPATAARAEAAESGSFLSPAGLGEESGGGPPPQQRFWATYPLRWRVSAIQENVDAANATFCSTVVSVRNLTDVALTVEVEWYEWTGVSKAIRTRLIPARREFQFASDNEINLRPYVPENDANLVNMNGYASVHSDDPRILASANLVCREGTASDAKLLVVRGIPTSAVGSTMELFRAGMPTLSAPQTLAE